MFVPILAYHKIQDRFDFSITRVAPREFERQISYLSDCGYSSVSLSDFLNERSTDGRKIVITFDDAYECVFKNAFPILSKYHFTATIFIISNFVGQWNQWDYNLFKIKTRHCDWTQLRTLASEGWEMGSHTASHQKLSSLSANQVWHELTSSKQVIEDQVKTSVQVISYPFGRFDDNILALVRRAGYKAGCTLGYSRNRAEPEPLALARRGVYLREPLPLFKVKLQDTVWAHYDDLKQKLITFCSQGSTYLRYLQSD